MVLKGFQIEFGAFLYYGGISMAKVKLFSL